jgi:hypothetical protein
MNLPSAAFSVKGSHPVLTRRRDGLQAHLKPASRRRSADPPMFAARRWPNVREFLCGGGKCELVIWASSPLTLGSSCKRCEGVASCR